MGYDATCYEMSTRPRHGGRCKRRSTPDALLSSGRQAPCGPQRLPFILKSLFNLTSSRLKSVYGEQYTSKLKHGHQERSRCRVTPLRPKYPSQATAYAGSWGWLTDADLLDGLRTPKIVGDFALVAGGAGPRRRRAGGAVLKGKGERSRHRTKGRGVTGSVGVVHE